MSTRSHLNLAAITSAPTSSDTLKRSSLTTGDSQMARGQVSVNGDFGSVLKVTQHREDPNIGGGTKGGGKSGDTKDGVHKVSATDKANHPTASNDLQSHASSTDVESADDVVVVCGEYDLDVESTVTDYDSQCEVDMESNPVQKQFGEEDVALVVEDEAVKGVDTDGVVVVTTAGVGSGVIDSAYQTVDLPTAPETEIMVSSAVVEEDLGEGAGIEVIDIDTELESDGVVVTAVDDDRVLTAEETAIAAAVQPVQAQQVQANRSVKESAADGVVTVKSSVAVGTEEMMSPTTQGSGQHNSNLQQQGNPSQAVVELPEVSLANLNSLEQQGFQVADELRTALQPTNSNVILTAASVTEMGGRIYVFEVQESVSPDVHTVVEQVRVAVSTARSEGQNIFHIQLAPQHLGTIEVQMEVVGDRVTAIKMLCNRPETRDMLMKEAGMLRQEVSKVIDTEGASLSFDLRSNDHNAHQFGASHHESGAGAGEGEAHVAAPHVADNYAKGTAAGDAAINDENGLNITV